MPPCAYSMKEFQVDRLTLAARHGNCPAVVKLLKKGALRTTEEACEFLVSLPSFLLVNDIFLKQKDSPLHWATRKGNLKMVQVLLEGGANPKLTNLVRLYITVYYCC